MANRFITGFDDHDTAGLAYEWTINGTLPQNATVVTDMNGQCLRMTSPYVEAAYVSVACDRYTLGVRVKVDSFAGSGGPMLILNRNGHKQIGISLSSAGALTVFTYWAGGPASGETLGTANFTVTSGVMNYIEWSVLALGSNSGAVELRVNGGVVLNLTNVTTIDTYFGSTGIDSFILCAGSLHVVKFDDVYFNDTTGTLCTGFMGDFLVNSHYPVGDGDTNTFTPSSGTDHYALVDEVVPDEDDYVETDTVGEEELYVVEDFKNNGADILIIQPTFFTQKADVGTCELSARYKTSGLDETSDPMYPSTQWTQIKDTRQVPVGDALRSAAGFNAAQFGVKRTA